MYVEIDIPTECTSIGDRQSFIQSIYEWGLDNLEDQEHWEYFKGFADTLHANASTIEFHIMNEIDGLAIKLTWS